MKFIDLFAGIGGFRIALERVGFQCSFSCEIDPACQQVYAKNYGEKPFGDIQKLDPQTLADFDILVAGFPCQPFSISGKQLGFEDIRGTLFWDICRIVRAKQPTVILLENVKYLIHHDHGHTLQVILSSLKNLGYHVSYQILNAKDFGLPQHRQRIFIVASKIKTFNFQYLKQQPAPPLRDFLDQTGDFEILDKSAYTLIDSPKQQASGLIFVGYRNKGIRTKGIRPNTEHLSRVHHQPNRIYSIDGIHPTMPSQETAGRFFIYIPEKDLVRKLTIQECYRIMGFPANFQLANNISAAYKQIGNSVGVNVAEAVAREILNQQLLSKSQSTNQNFKIAKISS
jgi:DNA (cytosine-5)-methyltransferase 1